MVVGVVPIHWLWLKTLIIAIAISVHSRHVPSSGIRNSLDEKDSDDDIDLDDIIVESYDDLLEELELLRSEIEKVELDVAVNMAEKAMINRKRKKEKIEKIKNILDYDYMGDAPEMSAEPERDLKILQQSLPYGESNISWVLLEPNGTIEDPALVKGLRERNKEMRLSAIRNTILELRNGNAEVNSTIPPTRALKEIFENNKDRIPKSPMANTYTERVQSFYPSCEVPRHADEEAWSDTSSMNMMFDVTFPTPVEGTAVNVVASKLRLYKMSQHSNSSAPEAPVAPDASRLLNHHFGVMPATVAPPDDDRLLRVSVYWYTRVLKKNRAKRKLMASQMFSIFGNEWMEFNIRTAVRMWRDSGKNYGIVVTVEDEDGMLLPAGRYLHAMNCSENAVVDRPLPTILLDAAQKYLLEHGDSNKTSENMTDSAESFVYPTNQYPKLDLRTIEVPISEFRSIIDDSSGSRSIGSSRRFNESNPNIENSIRISQRQLDENRNTYFTTVRLGSPAAGQNRNNLVPILTKSDVEATPEDVRLKNELLKLQSERTEPPRIRHNRRVHDK